MADKWLGYKSGEKKTYTETLSADGNTDIRLDAPSISFQIVGTGSPGTVAILASNNDTDFETILAATSTDQIIDTTTNAPYFRFTVASYSSGSYDVIISWFDGDGA